MTEILFRHGIFDGDAWYRYGYFDTNKKTMPMDIPIEIDSDLYEEYRYRLFSPIPFTIGYEPEYDIYAIAICSNNDNFSRKIGRSIVEGRLKRAIKVITGESITDKLDQNKVPVNRDKVLPKFVYIIEE